MKLKERANTLSTLRVFFEVFQASSTTIGSPLHRVIQWFKTMTTNAYIKAVNDFGWERFDGKLWQRNYYEHIIRKHNEYEIICDYMARNPAGADIPAIIRNG